VTFTKKPNRGDERVNGKATPTKPLVIELGQENKKGSLAAKPVSRGERGEGGLKKNAKKGLEIS